MGHPLKILVCIKPCICQKENCENCNSTEFTHHLKLDDLNLAKSNPPNENEKESGSLLSDVEGRRTSGKNLFRVKQLGVEDMVDEMLKDNQLTLKDIAEAIYKSTGQRISKASLSRYYKRGENKKV